MEPTTTLRSVARVPTMAPSRTWLLEMNAPSRTSTSSSRLDSEITTPGPISQNRPIRTAGPMVTDPSESFSASVFPVTSSRMYRDSGAMNTRRSGSNGGPRCLDTDPKCPWRQSTMVSR